MTESLTTYTWRIEQLDVVPVHGDLVNVVQNIHWRMVATDGTNTTSAYGDIPVGAADPSDFTIYEDLTEATVIEWLEDAIDERAISDGDRSVEELRQALAATLAAMRTPAVVAMPTPWSNN
jgi:hypothetical protein